MSRPIGPTELRRAFGDFATGVTIITTAVPNGEFFGMTANSFSSVSLEPPLVLFSLDRNADCYDAFESTDRFAINVLSAEQKEISTQFSTKDIDKWEGVKFTLGNSDCPLIEESLCVFECKIHARYPGGDHVIYVGKVEEMHALEEVQERGPLLFFRGAYATLGT